MVAGLILCLHFIYTAANSFRSIELSKVAQWAGMLAENSLVTTKSGNQYATLTPPDSPSFSLLIVPPSFTISPAFALPIKV